MSTGSPEVPEWASGSGLCNRKRFDNIQDYVGPNLLHHPAYLSIFVLPSDYKLAVSEKLDHYVHNQLVGQATDRLAGIISFMNGTDHSHSLPALMEYTKLLDATRGTNLSETLPELAPVWRQYYRAATDFCGSI